MLDRLKKKLDKLREWLIVKLGGYLRKPDERIRVEHVPMPIRTVHVQADYATGCPHSQLRKLVARELAERICDAGFVEYKYSDHTAFNTPEIGHVHASIRVVEPREGWL